MIVVQLKHQGAALLRREEILWNLYSELTVERLLSLLCRMAVWQRRVRDAAHPSPWKLSSSPAPVVEVSMQCHHHAPPTRQQFNLPEPILYCLQGCD